MVVPNYAWLQTFLRGRTSWQKHPREIICLANGATFSILEILYFKEIKRLVKNFKMRCKHYKCIFLLFSESWLTVMGLKANKGLKTLKNLQHAVTSAVSGLCTDPK